ncbi:MAG: aminotransferase class III-fold pyridoxal phosphate-dependent enzyme, partial [Bacteroides graminisolvens]
ISFSKSFHGRTSLAVEATDNPKIIAPINNNAHTTYLPLNDIEVVKAELSMNDVCAVIIEGIQGVGGIKLPDNDFLKELREACTATNTVLILDEIQSGYGRSGKFFAHQYAGIKPDIITVAKGIGNGFPIAGVLISPIFKPVYGMLGTTFGGNHLACAAALAVIDVIEKDHLTENAAQVGQYLLQQLKTFPQIKDVRGRGLMIGLEFEEPVKEIRNKLLYEEKVFTGVSGTNVIRLLPPLCLSIEQADEFLQRFKKVLG